MCSKQKWSNNSMAKKKYRLIFLLLTISLVLRYSGCNKPAQVASSNGVKETNGITETTFDDIKFDLQPDVDYEKSMLTPEVTEFFEKRIRIRGWILPTLTSKGIKEFILVRDNMECCFGPGAALYDCILVHMEEGKTATFSTLPVEVQGKFSYEEFLDWDGTTRAIYRLDGESVK